jgi:hypothetical protein
MVCLGAGAAYGAVDSEQLVRKLEDCRDRAEAQRMDCYDALVDVLRAGQAAGQQAAEATQQVTGAAAAAAVATEIPEGPRSESQSGYIEPAGAAAPKAQVAEQPAPVETGEVGIVSAEIDGSTVDVPPEATTEAGQAEAATVAAESLFGRDQSEAKDMIEQAFGVEKLDGIDVQVSRVERSAYGKLILALDNGQIWMQLDSSHLSLRPGDGVRIRAAAAGSYLLEKQTGSRRIRVRRVD